MNSFEVACGCHADPLYIYIIHIYIFGSTAVAARAVHVSVKHCRSEIVTTIFIISGEIKLYHGFEMPLEYIFSKYCLSFKTLEQYI